MLIHVGLSPDEIKEAVLEYTKDRVQSGYRFNLSNGEVELPEDSTKSCIVKFDVKIKEEK